MSVLHPRALPVLSGLLEKLSVDCPWALTPESYSASLVNWQPKHLLLPKSSFITLLFTCGPLAMQRVSCASCRAFQMASVGWTFFIPRKMPHVTVRLAANSQHLKWGCWLLLKKNTFIYVAIKSCTSAGSTKLKQLRSSVVVKSVCCHHGQRSGVVHGGLS